jgi:hypothetical protein
VGRAADAVDGGAGARRSFTVRSLALAAVLVLGVVGVSLGEEPPRVFLDTLRQRLVRGETATIEGRVYMERRKPNDPDEPLAGIGVLFVPHQPELRERLETVKRQSRDSVDGFRDAAPAARAAVLEYESRLWRRGYPEAAVRAVTDGHGRFRATVPAGAWIAFAERSVFVTLHSAREQPAPSSTALDPLARYSTNQYQHFQKVARVAGFDAVSVWLRDLEVQPGTTIVLDLHDRALWLSGVIEETETPRRIRSVGGRSRHR